jgi:hypothetical protein
MKIAALVFFLIASLILGTATAGMLSARSADLLRFSESLVCPQGSSYQFTTQPVTDVDPATNAPVTIPRRTVSCVENGEVRQADVTRQAERWFFWFITAGWFLLFLFIWLAAAVNQRLRRPKSA